MNRVTVIKDRDYVSINNKIIWNRKITLKAKGLYFTIMALPANWDFTIEGICKILKENRTAVYTAIGELVAFGYCQVKKDRNDKGQILKWEYFFYEQPLSGFPLVDYPLVDYPLVENQQQINININNSLSQENILSSSSALALYREVFPNESLSEEEKSFLENYPITDKNLFLLTLNHWKLKKWKTCNVTGIINRFNQELESKEGKKIGRQDDENRGNGKHQNGNSKKSDAEIYAEAHEQLQRQREREAL